HEFWEEIWLVEPEPEKTFLQGLIQVAAAFHHRQQANPEGAELLLAAGIVKLLRFPPDHRGLSIGALRENAKRWARALGTGRDLGNRMLPKLRVTRPPAKSKPAASGSKRLARAKAPR
ncbi:MAG TPA: DUF309 domain-containing protein, partial [Candidatus Acidoferrum sp.]|nr:DUF309 domain-containing protein [Candidatus Acidoferrum sp.]